MRREIETIVLVPPGPGCGLARCSEDPRRPMAGDDWLLPRRGVGYSPADLPQGGHVSVLTPEGDVWVGRCQFAEPTLLVLLLWGTGQVRQFHVAPGLSARVVAGHSFDQAVVCTRRQRAGLPAATVPAHAEKLRRAAARAAALDDAREQARTEARRQRAQTRIRARENRNEGDVTMSEENETKPPHETPTEKEPAPAHAIGFRLGVDRLSRDPMRDQPVRVEASSR